MNGAVFKTVCETVRAGSGGFDSHTPPPKNCKFAIADFLFFDPKSKIRDLKSFMAKHELKTKKTEASVEDFLNAIDDEQKRADAFAISEMMSKATRSEPKMWGPSIVGFGSRVLKYDSGRELDWMQIGFSPRKANLTLYVVIGTPEQQELLAKLGKHTASKGCLHIKRLSDIDEKVLKSMISDSVKHLKNKK